MRRLNAVRILDAVRRHGPISRANLAKRSRLSPPAVSALVDELIVKRGLLREVGQDVSTGGRRATLVSFAADHGYVVGVDLGSTTIRYALADLGGRVLAGWRNRRADRRRTGWWPSCRPAFVAWSEAWPADRPWSPSGSARRA